jgi:hypothetical protein
MLRSECKVQRWPVSSADIAAAAACATAGEWVYFQLAVIGQRLVKWLRLMAALVQRLARLHGQGQRWCRHVSTGT